MNINLIKKNYKNIEIKNVISSKKIEKKVQKKLKKLKKTVSVQGFRQGKTPNQIIEKNFRNDVLHSVLKKFIDKHLQDIIKKKKIKKYSNVQYLIKRYKKGRDFNYTLKFKIISNKLIKKLKLITLKIPKIKIKKSDILKTILNLQKNITNWSIKKNKIKENDKVKIKYKIISKDKKIVLKENNFSILINKSLLFKKMYKNILNKKIQDKFKIKKKFSKYHPEKKISGKTMFINIKIENVKEKKVEKIDFKKIKNFGIKEKNLMELEKNVYKILKKESQKISREYLKKQFIKKWIKINIEKIPKKIIKKEKKNLYKNYLFQYKKDKNIFSKKYDKNLKKKCKIKLIIQNLIYQIITQESLEVSKKLIKKIFKQEQKNLYSNQFLKNKKIKKKEILKNIKNFLLVEKAFNFIFKNVSLKDKKTNFSKILEKINK
jgi:trigger factor